MPYKSNQDLPPTIRSHLPSDAQALVREAFNGAWEHYAHRTDREEVAHRVAWSAVKKRYEKAGETWVTRPELPALRTNASRRTASR